LPVSVIFSSRRICTGSWCTVGAAALAIAFGLFNVPLLTSKIKTNFE
jgi:hypothetical protein